MLNLTFKINPEMYASLSDNNLTNSGVKNKNVTNSDIITQNIINSKLFKISSNDSLNNIWAHLQNYINQNSFYLQDVLLLKKGWTIRSLENNKTNKVENVCIIISSNDSALKWNSICFYTDIKKSNNSNLDPLDIFIKRIEFQNFNKFKSVDCNNQIYLNDLAMINNNYSSFSDWEIILREAKPIFDHDDYNEDKVRIKDWLGFVKGINNGLFIDDNKDENSNFVINFNNNNFILSKLEITSLNDYKFNDTNSGDEVIIEEGNAVKIYPNDIYKLIKQEQNDLIDKNLELNQKIESLKEENSEFNMQISDEKKQIQYLDSTIAKKNRELESKELRIEQLKQELKDLKQNEVDEKAIFSLKEIIDNLGLEANLIKDNIKKFENKLNEAEQKLKTASNNLKKNNSDIQNLELLINTNKNNIKYYGDFITKYKDKFIYTYLLENSNSLNDYLPQIIDINKKRIDNYSFFDNDRGTRSIVKRFFNALRNIEEGYYKNPYLYLGIKDVSSIAISNKHNLSQDLLDKYGLNKKQLEAVIKAINTDSVFYLQGPPGTGKTQTICAIADWITKNNMKLVMTSSTHEAINNFFDRFSELSKSNPNIIAYKYKFVSVEDKKNSKQDDHGEESIFAKFKSRMMNNIIVNNDKNNKLRELFNKFNDKYSSYKNKVIDLFNTIVLPEPIIDQLFINHDSELFINQFMNRGTNIKKNVYSTLEDLDFSNESDKSVLIRKNTKILDEQKDVPKEVIDLFNELVAEHIYVFKQINKSIDNFQFNMNYFNSLNKLLSNNQNSSNILGDLLFAIKNQYQNKLDSLTSEFLDYIIDNQLLNVIGVTTTSRNEINLNGTEINLYNEYPIDYMIIDEISKCSTPEILSKAILAKKILFVGDYLQLPPSSNLSNDKICSYIKNHPNAISPSRDTNIEEYQQLFKDANDVRSWIETLFKESFFAKQIERIKAEQYEYSPYEFLNESHRFGVDIMDIINIIYPTDEKLKMPENSKFQCQNINLKIQDQNLVKSAVLINVCKPTQSFKDEYEFQLEISDEGFDQTGEMFRHRKLSLPRLQDGTYNQFSAHIIIKLVKKLIIQNETFFKSGRRIGIITLTRNQKIIVKDLIKNDSFLSNKQFLIKVDTIDNFQGREEEVVIVDFIRGKTKVENMTCLPVRSGRNLSFLSEKERINVALSRAKQKLILVGQFKYLKSIEQKYFAQYYNQLVSSIDSYLEWTDACEGEE